MEPVEHAGSMGFGVRELVTLKGNISEGERVRLQRASRYCPVGQALTKGSMAIEDEVQWQSGEVTSLSPNMNNLPALEGALPAIQPGTVHGSYLLDTKEYDEAGIMQHEGEAKIYVETPNLTHTSRWILMAGHSSPGLIPPPFPSTHAGWAASTVATLSSLLPVDDGDDVRDLRVEVGLNMSGGRELSQGSAAEGRIVHRNAVRRIVAPGTPAHLAHRNNPGGPATRSHHPCLHRGRYPAGRAGGGRVNSGHATLVLQRQVDMYVV